MNNYESIEQSKLKMFKRNKVNSCSMSNNLFIESNNVPYEKMTFNLKMLDTIATVFGLASYESRNNPLMGNIQKCILFINNILVIYAVTSQIYFGIKTGLTSLQLIVIILSLMSSKVLCDAALYGKKLDQIIIILIMKLGPKYQCKIKRTQLIFLIILVSAIIIDVLYLFIFIFIDSGLSKDAEIILHGSRNILGNKWMLLFSALNFNNAIFIFFISSFNYVTIQILLRYFAIECEQDFLTMVKSSNLQLIKRNCQFFNRSRRVVNEAMGFTPFFIFTLKWVSFVFGLTMLIKNKDKFSSGTTLPMILGVIVGTTILLFAIVSIVYTTDLRMNDSRRVVQEYLNEKVCNVNSLNEWKCLKSYLKEEPIIHAMVWHFFELHPSLILISYNSMATFSVMVLTTLSAFLS